MAELSPDDLPEVVRARFDNDDTAQAAIDEVLTAARRWCGWHVSPVQSSTITVNEVAHSLIALPTLKLTAITSITEDGDAVDLNSLNYAIPGDGQSIRSLVAKKKGCWSSSYGAIAAVISHGFTEAEAADWRRAVLKVVDSWSQATTRDSSDLKRKKVNNVEYEWFEALVSTDHELSARFSPFRILPAP